MSPYPVADAHVDLITHLLEQTPPLPLPAVASGHLTVDGLRAGAVRFMVCSFYIADSFNGPGTASARLTRLMEAMGAMTAPLRPAFRASTMENIFQEETGPAGFCHLVENCDALLETDLFSLTERGVRLAGLTHVGGNRLADGNAVVCPGGLRAEGRALLHDVAAAGFAVDLSHLAEPGFWEVVEDYPGPLLVSHTGLRTFLDRPRNLSDEQAAAVVERGGLICLTFAPEILAANNQASVDTVTDHIDHLAQRHGTAHLGLGSDFGGFDGTCAGLEDCSRFQDLARALLARGYPEACVAGIMGRNLMDFLGALYPA